MGLYLYGFTFAAAPESLPSSGVEGNSVRAITHQGIAALVSDGTENPRPSRANLTAHLSVLEEVVANNTVAPLRFGTVLNDSDELLTHLMIPEHDRLLELLRKVSGKVEVRLTGTYDEQAVLPRVIAADRSLQRLRARAASDLVGQIALGEAVSKALDRFKDRDRSAVLRPLVPLAHDHSMGSPITEMMFVNASFLVDRQELEHFDEAVWSATEAFRAFARFDYAGPLPAYSFVDLELGREN